MKPEEDAAYRARRRAIQIVHQQVFGDVPVTHDDAQKALEHTLTFYEASWLGDLLELVGKVAAAEVTPSAWEPEPLPTLMSEEMDAQTDQIVRQAFEDPEAPTAPTTGMRI